MPGADDSAFERFLASTLAAILTIIFSWQILIDVYTDDHKRRHREPALPSTSVTVESTSTSHVESTSSVQSTLSVTSKTTSIKSPVTISVTPLETSTSKSSQLAQKPASLPPPPPHDVTTTSNSVTSSESVNPLIKEYRLTAGTLSRLAAVPDPIDLYTHNATKLTKSSDTGDTTKSVNRDASPVLSDRRVPEVDSFDQKPLSRDLVRVINKRGQILASPDDFDSVPLDDQDIQQDNTKNKSSSVTSSSISSQSSSVTKRGLVENLASCSSPSLFNQTSDNITIKDNVASSSQQNKPLSLLIGGQFIKGRRKMAFDESWDMDEPDDFQEIYGDEDVDRHNPRDFYFIPVEDSDEDDDDDHYWPRRILEAISEEDEDDISSEYEESESESENEEGHFSDDSLNVKDHNDDDNHEEPLSPKDQNLNSLKFPTQDLTGIQSRIDIYEQEQEQNLSKINGHNFSKDSYFDLSLEPLPPAAVTLEDSPPSSPSSSSPGCHDNHDGPSVPSAASPPAALSVTDDGGQDSMECEEKHSLSPELFQPAENNRLSPSLSEQTRQLCSSLEGLNRLDPSLSSQADTGIIGRAFLQQNLLKTTTTMDYTNHQPCTNGDNSTINISNFDDSKLDLLEESYRDCDLSDCSKPAPRGFIFSRSYGDENKEENVSNYFVVRDRVDVINTASGVAPSVSHAGADSPSPSPASTITSPTASPRIITSSAASPPHNNTTTTATGLANQNGEQDQYEPENAPHSTHSYQTVKTDCVYVIELNSEISPREKVENKPENIISQDTDKQNYSSQIQESPILLQDSPGLLLDSRSGLLDKKVDNRVDNTVNNVPVDSRVDSTISEDIQHEVRSELLAQEQILDSHINSTDNGVSSGDEESSTTTGETAILNPGNNRLTEITDDDVSEISSEIDIDVINELQKVATSQNLLGRKSNKVTDLDASSTSSESEDNNSEEHSDENSDSSASFEFNEYTRPEPEPPQPVRNLGVLDELEEEELSTSDSSEAFEDAEAERQFSLKDLASSGSGSSPDDGQEYHDSSPVLVTVNEPRFLSSEPVLFSESRFAVLSAVPEPVVTVVQSTEPRSPERTPERTPVLTPISQPSPEPVISLQTSVCTQSPEARHSPPLESLSSNSTQPTLTIHSGDSPEFISPSDNNLTKSPYFQTQFNTPSWPRTIVRRHRKYPNMTEIPEVGFFTNPEFEDKDTQTLRSYRQPAKCTIDPERYFRPFRVDVTSFDVTTEYSNGESDVKSFSDVGVQIRFDPLWDKSEQQLVLSPSATPTRGSPVNVERDGKLKPKELFFQWPTDAGDSVFVDNTKLDLESGPNLANLDTRRRRPSNERRPSYDAIDESEEDLLEDASVPILDMPPKGAPPKGRFFSSPQAYTPDRPRHSPQDKMETKLDNNNDVGKSDSVFVERIEASKPAQAVHHPPRPRSGEFLDNKTERKNTSSDSEQDASHDVHRSPPKRRHKRCKTSPSKTSPSKTSTSKVTSRNSSSEEEMTVEKVHIEDSSDADDESDEEARVPLFSKADTSPLMSPSEPQEWTAPMDNFIEPIGNRSPRNSPSKLTPSPSKSSPSPTSRIQISPRPRPIPQPRVKTSEFISASRVSPVETKPNLYNTFSRPISPGKVDRNSPKSVSPLAQSSVSTVSPLRTSPKTTSPVKSTSPKSSSPVQQSPVTVQPPATRVQSAMNIQLTSTLSKPNPVPRTELKLDTKNQEPKPDTKIYAKVPISPKPYTSALIEPISTENRNISHLFTLPDKTTAPEREKIMHARQDYMKTNPESKNEEERKKLLSRLLGTRDWSEREVPKPKSILKKPKTFENKEEEDLPLGYRPTSLDTPNLAKLCKSTDNIKERISRVVERQKAEDRERSRSRSNSRGELERGRTERRSFTLPAASNRAKSLDSLIDNRSLTLPRSNSKSSLHRSPSMLLNKDPISFFSDRKSYTNLLETDLDNATLNVVPLIKETDLDSVKTSNFTRARSKSETRDSFRRPVVKEVYDEHLEKTKSMEQLSETKTVQLSAFHGTPEVVQVSKDTSRLSKSLGQLDLPDWYVNAPTKPEDVDFGLQCTKTPPSSTSTSFDHSKSFKSGNTSFDTPRSTVLSMRVSPPRRTPSPKPVKPFELPSEKFRKNQIPLASRKIISKMRPPGASKSMGDLTSSDSKEFSLQPSKPSVQSDSLSPSVLLSKEKEMPKMSVGVTLQKPEVKKPEPEAKKTEPEVRKPEPEVKKLEPETRFKSSATLQLKPATPPKPMVRPPPPPHKPDLNKKPDVINVTPKVTSSFETAFDQPSSSMTSPTLQATVAPSATLVAPPVRTSAPPIVQARAAANFADFANFGRPPPVPEPPQPAQAEPSPKLAPQPKLSTNITDIPFVDDDSPQDSEAEVDVPAMIMPELPVQPVQQISRPLQPSVQQSYRPVALNVQQPIRPAPQSLRQPVRPVHTSIPYQPAQPQSIRPVFTQLTKPVELSRPVELSKPVAPPAQPSRTVLNEPRMTMTTELDSFVAPKPVQAYMEPPRPVVTADKPRTQVYMEPATVSLEKPKEVFMEPKISSKPVEVYMEAPKMETQFVLEAPKEPPRLIRPRDMEAPTRPLPPEPADVTDFPATDTQVRLQAPALQAACKPLEPKSISTTPSQFYALNCIETDLDTSATLSPPRSRSPDDKPDYLRIAVDDLSGSDSAKENQQPVERKWAPQESNVGVLIRHGSLNKPAPIETSIDSPRLLDEPTPRSPRETSFVSKASPKVDSTPSSPRETSFLSKKEPKSHFIFPKPAPKETSFGAPGGPKDTNSFGRETNFGAPKETNFGLPIEVKVSVKDANFGTPAEITREKNTALETNIDEPSSMYQPPRRSDYRPDPRNTRSDYRPQYQTPKPQSTFQRPHATPIETNIDASPMIKRNERHPPIQRPQEPSPIAPVTTTRPTDGWKTSTPISVTQQNNQRGRLPSRETNIDVDIVQQPRSPPMQFERSLDNDSFRFNAPQSESTPLNLSLESNSSIRGQLRNSRPKSRETDIDSDIPERPPPRREPPPLPYRQPRAPLPAPVNAHAQPAQFNGRKSVETDIDADLPRSRPGPQPPQRLSSLNSRTSRQSSLNSRPGSVASQASDGYFDPGDLDTFKRMAREDPLVSTSSPRASPLDANFNSFPQYGAPLGTNVRIDHTHNIYQPRNSVPESPTSPDSPHNNSLVDVLDGLLGMEQKKGLANTSDDFSDPNRKRTISETRFDIFNDITRRINEDMTMIRCRNSRCGKTLPMRQARTMYVSCTICYCYYCSEECRSKHFPRHEQRCTFSRVENSCRLLSRKLQTDAILSHQISGIARTGYHSQGRGCVLVTVESPLQCDQVLNSGRNALKSQPVYCRLSEFDNEPSIADNTMDLAVDYNPNSNYVINVCCKVTRRTTELVRHAETATLNNVQTPSISVNDKQPREQWYYTVQNQLRERNVELRRQYPDVYNQMVRYVDGNVPFQTVTIYPVDNNGRTFVCSITPDKPADIRSANWNKPQFPGPRPGAPGAQVQRVNGAQRAPQGPRMAPPRGAPVGRPMYQPPRRAAVPNAASKETEL